MLYPPPLLLLPLLAVFRGVTPLSALASAPYKHFDLAKLCGRTRTKQSLYLHNQAHRCESYSTQTSIRKLLLALITTFLPARSREIGRGHEYVRP